MSLVCTHFNVVVKTWLCKTTTKTVKLKTMTRMYKIKINMKVTVKNILIPKIKIRVQKLCLEMSRDQDSNFENYKLVLQLCFVTV